MWVEDREPPVATIAKPFPTTDIVNLCVKISQVGKVFPKNPIQEEVDEKLDLFCVGLEKDKDTSLPTVELDFEEGQVCTTLKSGDGSEIIVSTAKSSDDSGLGCTL